MANCITCGKELTDSDRLGDTCDDFACWEAAYCHQPEVAQFEKFVLDEVPPILTHA
jgi:hypothetical protein